jgi:C-terminal processing protease CtpA/Prc
MPRPADVVGIEYDSTEDGSMVVEKVLAGSPAEKAGLKAATFWSP